MRGRGVEVSKTLFYIGESYERKVKKLMDKYRNDIMKIW